MLLLDLERRINVPTDLPNGVEGELVEQSPKSHKSREVPLIAALRPYVEDAARGKQPDELLLAGPDGGRLTNHNARRAVDWDALRAAIGRPDLRMHDLRHTFATIILFDAGTSALDVQATLGHFQPPDHRTVLPRRKGVALRAGAVLDQALGGGTSKGAGAGREGKSDRGNGPRMARTRQDWGQKRGVRQEKA
ncbi:MAG: tyrosine-type recombinase/integrase [Microbacteriaceae bacterium]